MWRGPSLIMGRTNEDTRNPRGGPAWCRAPPHQYPTRLEVPVAAGDRPHARDPLVWSEWRAPNSFLAVGWGSA